MTRKARICQDDLDRACKAAFRSGASHAQIIARLDDATLQIILSNASISDDRIDNPWEQDSGAA